MYRKYHNINARQVESFLTYYRELGRLEAGRSFTKILHTLERYFNLNRRQRLSMCSIRSWLPCIRLRGERASVGNRIY